MANMSYCRWQNTALDLADCASDLEERMASVEERDGPAPLSHDEKEAMARLFRTMTEMLEQIGVGVDDDAESALTELKI